MVFSLRVVGPFCFVEDAPEVVCQFQPLWRGSQWHPLVEKARVREIAKQHDHKHPILEPCVRIIPIPEQRPEPKY